MKSVLFVTTNGVNNLNENFNEVIGSNLFISLAVIVMVAVLHYASKSRVVREIQK